MVTHNAGGAAAAVAFLTAAPSGMRVVVRYLLEPGSEAGATDALGFVHASDDTHCVIATKRGLETIAFAAVLAAKEVPPAPPRRRIGNTSR
jgi:hypothetical protein